MKTEGSQETATCPFQESGELQFYIQLFEDQLRNYPPVLHQNRPIGSLSSSFVTKILGVFLIYLTHVNTTIKLR